MKKKLVILTLILFNLLLFSCKKETNNKKKDVPKPGQVFKEGMTIKATKQGKTEWEMKVKTLIQQEKKVKTVTGEDVNLFFYDKDGSLKVEVVADNGEADLTNNNVTLIGNVVLTNKKNNTKLFTEKLNYRSKSGSVYTEKEVKIKKDSSVIHGKGLEADLELNEYEIKQPYGQN